MTLMKQLLFTAAFLLFSLSLFGQTSDLKRFRHGKFKVPSDTEGDYVIIRKGNRQIEFMEKIGVQAVFIVDWKSDSIYTLRPAKNSVRLFPRFPKNALITVRILEVKENSYIQLTSSNFDEYKYTSEIFKVED
jgi:hypothetical protein